MVVFHNYILYNYSFIIPRTVDNHVLSQYYYLDNKDLQLYICLLVGLVNNFKKEKKLNTLGLQSLKKWSTNVAQKVIHSYPKINVVTFLKK